ncbi:pyridoxal phosphate-dependent aminotransferase [candidate division TA06 bacterium DG_24]|uniref:UDP-4-amino-4, 6-dideoxy-N-acetyl-beta-L-altrosamine transaminase n=3 Tax=Bacteria division TA06 TaxID=1156500 RepID=A0A0S8JS24_UNCT6|nr:MAG: pyridoxal phosphate-dependent aminotransferase [candidate division TA06 bacterium DG_24]KPK71683.1 MAG: UDP-4-amino-4,6-dideoxy-N-acetyl-beta-L-altrosamine transaminase [candidate division TA06 bacterium SM23_40]KPL11589.1 MAG: UDP-4-amino-4,6-dideoxy-N-acetyl-beta-L-altrosamine transaminase [candidate division TA06 bacterium SM1_40]
MEGGSPTREQFLVFGAPLLGPEEIDEVVDTLRSGWIGTGPKVMEFERRFADYVGASHAVAVSSCTAALHLALSTLGVGAGDEVITSPLTFAATVNVIVQLGATPVFADIVRETMNIDPESIERAITRRTKVIVPVHFAGQPCQMDEIMGIANRHDLDVVEDAAHAVGAMYHGQKVGSLGHLTAFSFYPNKNITTIEGGMVTTESSTWAERIRRLRLHGLSSDAWGRYNSSKLTLSMVEEPGYKYNMTDVQASLGIHQLSKIERFRRRRRKIAEIYDRAFRPSPYLMLPSVISGIRHAHHLYVVHLNLDTLKVDRDRVAGALLAENIGTGIHYIALHLHPFYREWLGHRRGDFPNAEDVSARTLSLPLTAGMHDQDAKDVVSAVRKVLRHFRR